MDGSDSMTTAGVPDLVVRGALIYDAGDPSCGPITGDLVIQGGTIRASGPGAADPFPRAAEEMPGASLVAMPGLVNAHFHSPGNLLKGAVANLPLELFMLYEVPPFMQKPVSARVAYLRTMLGALEMLKQGVTAVHDDAFFLPVVTDDEVDAVMRAYRDSGLRAVVALDQPNELEYKKHPYLDSILSTDQLHQMRNAARQTDDELLAHYRRFIDEWDGRADGRLGVQSHVLPHNA